MGWAEGGELFLVKIEGILLTAGCMKGGEKYQQAYYVFEELAQTPSTTTASTLVGQAVAEIHLGRLEEADVALQQALAKDPKHSEALANTIALNVLAGKDATEQLRRVSLDWIDFIANTCVVHSRLPSQITLYSPISNRRANYLIKQLQSML